MLGSAPVAIRSSEFNEQLNGLQLLRGLGPGGEQLLPGRVLVFIGRSVAVGRHVVILDVENEQGRVRTRNRIAQQKDRFGHHRTFELLAGRLLQLGHEIAKLARTYPLGEDGNHGHVIYSDEGWSQPP
jgi:hypothetical protein